MWGYLTWLRAGNRSAGTVELRRGHLARLAEQCADPWRVTSQQLAGWLSNPDWKAETKRSLRSTLRSFYGWGVKTGRIALSPAVDLEAVMLPRSLPRPAPDDVLRMALLRANDRTRIALMLAGYAGLRAAEIAAVHTRQIGDGELLVIGKGGHHRRVPLHPHLRSELDAEMARRRRGEHGSGFRGRFLSDTGYLFPSDREPGPITSHHLSKLVGQALLGVWTTHTLRHRFATAAYLVERDLRAVQELLGHTKPETTARYAAVPEGALRSAVDGVGV
jgi:site-specific recombinase XerC